MGMTQHTLKYINKRNRFCKAVKAEPEKTPPSEAEPQKPNITEDIANDYIKQNPATVSDYLRNERALEAKSR